MNLILNKNYWNKRASKYKDKFKTTSNYISIKEFEISILNYIIEKKFNSKEIKILELGCGNGVNLINLKKKYPKFKLFGMDYSQEMIKYAQKRAKNINFILSDISNTNIYKQLPKFDFIFTNRCLINIKSKKRIETTIKIASYFLKKNGYIAFLENFIGGHKNKNNLRNILNLSRRKVANFNRFINEKTFIKFLEQHFKVVENVNYSSLHDLFLYVLLPENSKTINYNSKIQKKLTYLLIRFLEKNKTFLTLNINSGQNSLIVCKKK